MGLQGGFCCALEQVADRSVDLYSSSDMSACYAGVRLGVVALVGLQL
jgi:hypothetical protein